MGDISLFTAGFLVIVFGWVIVRSSGGEGIFRAPTYLTVAYLGLLFTHYLPSLEFFLAGEKSKAGEFYVLVIGAMFALAIGGHLGSVLFQVSGTKTKAAYARFAEGGLTIRDARFVRRIGWLCVGIFALYLATVSVWPFLRLVTGSSSNEQINAFRRDVIGPTMGSPMWPLFSLARAAIMPLLFVSIYLVWRYDKKHRVLFVFFAGIVVVFNSWAAAKTHVVLLVLMVGFAALVKQGPWVVRLRTNRRARRRARVVAVSCLLLAVGYPMFVFSFKSFGQAHDYRTVLNEGIFERVIGGPVNLSYTQLELFPARIPYTEFRDVQLYASVTGQKPVNLSMLTAIEVIGDPESNAPPAAIGVFWAQGGWPVVIIGFVLVGVGLQAVQAWTIRKLPSSVLSIGFVALFCWLSFRLSMSSADSLLLFDGLLPTMILALWWKTGRRQRVRVPPSDAMRRGSVQGIRSSGPSSLVREHPEQL